MLSFDVIEHRNLIIHYSFKHGKHSVILLNIYFNQLIIILDSWVWSPGKFICVLKNLKRSPGKLYCSFSWKIVRFLENFLRALLENRICSCEIFKNAIKQYFLLWSILFSWKNRKWYVRILRHLPRFTSTDLNTIEYELFNCFSFYHCQIIEISSAIIL